MQRPITAAENQRRLAEAQRVPYFDDTYDTGVAPGPHDEPGGRDAEELRRDCTPHRMAAGGGGDDEDRGGEARRRTPPLRRMVVAAVAMTMRTTPAVVTAVVAPDRVPSGNLLPARTGKPPGRYRRPPVQPG